VVTRLARRLASACLASLAAVLVVAGSATAEPASVAGKRAEAQRVLAQIREIDSSLAHAAEAYNLANIELDRIKGEQRQNARHLALARTNLDRAQTALEARLVALYTAPGADSTLEVILGATSLEDVLNRLEAAERVSDQDAKVLGQVQTFRDQVQRRRGQLARARTRQAQTVAARAARKREIEGHLAERRSLLSSIESEIARLRAEERARQAVLERQARARLLAQASVVTPVVSAQPQSEEPLGIDGLAQAIAVAPPARYGGVVGIAMGYLGTPYRWGGADPSGFDCSGFIMYVYAQVGVSLPHNAAAQFGYGTPVSRDQLQPGDLVFFDGLGHNGIYIGGSQFIHSPHTGDVVKISSLSDSWYAARWVGARRL
jgi:cell wall-associated NlpC family hydrolase